MNKNILIAVLGLAVVVLVVLLFRPERPNGEYTEKDIGRTVVDPKTGVTNVVSKVETKTDGETTTKIVAAPIVRSVERRPLEPEATKRLHDGPVIVSSIFEASGRGEHASYGKTVQGGYLYTTTVRARSQAVEKDEDSVTGKVRVVEKRTFLQARDHLELSDLDAKVALDTLPVAQARSWANGIVNVVGGIVILCDPASAPVVATVKASVEGSFLALGQIDGASARGMLGLFDVKVPENLEAYIRARVAQYAGKQLRDVHVALQSIEGKTYLITYTQTAAGMPLNVDFAREGGGPITEAEWEILRSANIFLDSNVVRDTRCRVGDRWTVWADEVQELFGVAGDGRADGKIRVVRAEDRPNGTWTLKVEPSEISFLSNDGTVSGSMQVKDGNGLVDAENGSVESLHATATGSLAGLSRTRHATFFDFVKRLKGDSDLRFTLTVDPDIPEAP